MARLTFEEVGGSDVVEGLKTEKKEAGKVSENEVETRRTKRFDSRRRCEVLVVVHDSPEVGFWKEEDGVLIRTGGKEEVGQIL